MTTKKTAKTMSLKGNNYAKVADRMKEFVTDNPRFKLETSSVAEGDQRVFKAHILADKADPNSKEATGHSMGKLTNEKSFEKLETIAVGRALAFLGYAADGDIASSEEMEEFEAHKQEKHAEEVEDSLKKMDKAKSVEELRKIFSSLSVAMTKDPQVIDHGTKLKQQLNEKITNRTE